MKIIDVINSTNKQKTFNVFFDMDGVLANTSAAISNMMNVSIDLVENEYCPLADTERWLSHLNLKLTPEQFWTKTNNSDFWQNIPEYPWTHELWQTISKYANTFVCSYPLPYVYKSASGKILWLNKTLGTPIGFYKFILTPFKYLLAKENTVLVDDSSLHVNHFKYHGGQAVLWPTPWNEYGKYDAHTGIQEILSIIS